MVKFWTLGFYTLNRFLGELSVNNPNEQLNQKPAREIIFSEQLRAICFLLVLLLTLFVTSAYSFDKNVSTHEVQVAGNTLGILETYRLKGINTIAVEIEQGANHFLLREILKNRSDAPAYGNIILNAFKDVFSLETRVSIIPWSEIISTEKNIDQNTLLVKFRIFIQRDSYESKEIQIAVLTAKYLYYENGKFVEMPMIPAVVPFVVPAEYADFAEKLEGATRKLTQYMPAFYSCANKASDAEKCTKVDVNHMWSEK